MKKDKIDNEAMKLQLYKFTAAALALLCAPIAIIYLFEQGFWMSISMFFYAACWGGYLSFGETFFPQLRKMSSTHQNSAVKLCISACVCILLLLILVGFFPFAMISKNFINWVNVVFGLELVTSYEGGIIVSFFTLCIIGYSIYMFVMFYNAVCNNGRRELLHGIYAFSIILLLSFTFSLLKIYNSTPENYQIIQSQEEKENNQLDRDIQHYRMQKYKKYSDHEY